MESSEKRDYTSQGTDAVDWSVWQEKKRIIGKSPWRDCEMTQWNMGKTHSQALDMAERSAYLAPEKTAESATNLEATV